MQQHSVTGDIERYYNENKYLLTYLLTPWSRVLLEKLTSFAANQEIPRILCNPKVHYRTPSGRVAQSVKRLVTGWTVRGSNPVEGEIFPTRPDRPWGPPSLLYSGYRVFPGRKAAGAWCWPPTPIFSAEVLKRVELYLYLPKTVDRPLWSPQQTRNCCIHVEQYLCPANHMRQSCAMGVLVCWWTGELVYSNDP